MVDLFSSSTYNNMTVLAETPVGTCSSRLFLASGDNVTVTCQHGRDRWEYMAMYGEHTIVSEVSRRKTNDTVREVN